MRGCPSEEGPLVVYKWEGGGGKKSEGGEEIIK
jgi:hypothetical protein